jgi:colanic acid/amylovoran biosynthesis glycosyltransferase
LKRIVYLTRRFPDADQPSTTAEVTGLMERGFELEVRVFRPQYREPGDPLPLDLPVRSSPLGTLAGLRVSRHPARLFSAATAGAWLARRLDPARDHVHAQFPLAAASAGMYAARRSGASFSFGGHVLNGLDLMPAKLAQARFVAVGSEFEREVIASRYGDDARAKVHVRRLGVPPRPPRDDFVPRTIVSVGAMAGMKGHDILIRAIDALRRNGIEARLELIGEGPDQPGLQGIVAALGLGDLVTFAGVLPHDEMLDRVAHAEVFALTCRETRSGEVDSLPVTLMDAMSLGVPCVSSRAFGIPELIEDGVSGLLASPADPDQVADCLSRILGNPSAQETLGAAGRETVRDRYDRDRNLDALAQLFREQLA